MIVPDANLLLYAYNASAKQHVRARQWWEDALSGDESVGLSWQTLTAFIRIGTNPRAFPRPLLAAEAVELVTAWLDQPNTRLVSPGSRHWSILRHLIAQSQITGPLVMDAHLAALALEHGAILCTTDRDFSRFGELDVRDPLADV